MITKATFIIFHSRSLRVLVKEEAIPAFHMSVRYYSGALCWVHLMTAC